jgi:ABC-2 type transport system permease protein
VIHVPTIARRELAGYFYSPVAYVVATLFLVLQGFTFWFFVRALSDPSAPPGAVMQFYFGGTILFWIALVLATATIPMRLLAEERRAGTLEPLLTAPVTDADVVLGKYLAALGFYVFLWLPTLAYVFILRHYAPPGQLPEWGPIAAGYLGTLLEGAAFLAVGLFASSLTSNQIIAAVLSFVFVFLLLLFGVVEQYVASDTVRAVSRHFNLFKHMDDFGRGIVDTRAVACSLSVAVLALFGTVKVLESRRFA